MQVVATPAHLAADAAGTALDPALDRVLAGQSGPVTLMLHGFKYCPFHRPTPRDPVMRDPHRLIYAAHPASVSKRVASWPALLQRPGPVIGIGWPALHEGYGPLAAMRGFGAVYARAGLVAVQVAQLADRIAQIDPTRRIDIVAHSLGARVALAALPRMRRAEPARILLWGAAERAATARHIMAEAPERTTILNIRACTNARYDSMFEWAAPGHGPALGKAAQIPNMTTLTLDDCATERALAARGLPLAPAPRGTCHWSFYTRAGTGALYAALLDQPGIWTTQRISALCQEQAQVQTSLRTLLGAVLPLPKIRGA